mmetsp:Transcript_114485/g.304341  ORF Transcript_114485/g.304341 Transcript_114485/m.304341 type:complete len:322 (+) Transcript_114485:338-1303(+)
MLYPVVAACLQGFIVVGDCITFTCFHLLVPADAVLQVLGALGAHLLKPPSNLSKGLILRSSLGAGEQCVGLLEHQRRGVQRRTALRVLAHLLHLVVVLPLVRSLGPVVIIVVVAGLHALGVHALGAPLPQSPANLREGLVLRSSLGAGKHCVGALDHQGGGVHRWTALRFLLHLLHLVVVLALVLGPGPVVVIVVVAGLPSRCPPRGPAKLGEGVNAVRHVVAAEGIGAACLVSRACFQLTVVAVVSDITVAGLQVLVAVTNAGALRRLLLVGVGKRLGVLRTRSPVRAQATRGRASHNQHKENARCHLHRSHDSLGRDLQ